MGKRRKSSNDGCLIGFIFIVGGSVFLIMSAPIAFFLIVLPLAAFLLVKLIAWLKR